MADTTVENQQQDTNLNSTTNSTNGKNVGTQTLASPPRSTTRPNLFLCCCGARAGRASQNKHTMPTVDIEIEDGQG